MGSHRFYCCPFGLIQKDDLPEGWGLIWVDENGKARLVYQKEKGNVSRYRSRLPKCFESEHGFMYSILRRLHLQGKLKDLKWSDELPTEDHTA